MASSLTPRMFLRRLARFPIRSICSSSISYDASSSSSSSTPSPVKVPIALVAELRRHNPISLSKAREALAASNNSVPAALEWLQNDLEASGAKKVAKVGGRETSEGLIGVSLMGTRAAMVEVRSETDFVGRNEVFRNLVNGIASTVAFHDPPNNTSDGDLVPDPLISSSVSELMSAPLIPTDPTSSLLPRQDQSMSPPQTISQAITSAITQTGENIVLQRAISFCSPLSPSDTTNVPFLLPGVFVHGAVKSGGKEGKVGGLVILSISSRTPESIMQRLASDSSLGGDLQRLAKTVARQAVGFPTKAVSRSPGEQVESEDSSLYLMEQVFMMFGSGEERTVKTVLEQWGAEKEVTVVVKALQRWAVGDN